MLDYFKVSDDYPRVVETVRAAAKPPRMSHKVFLGGLLASLGFMCVFVGHVRSEPLIVHGPDLVIMLAEESCVTLDSVGIRGSKLGLRVIRSLAISKDVYEILLSMKEGDWNKAIGQGVFLVVGITRAGLPMMVLVVVGEMSKVASDMVYDHLRGMYPSLVCDSAEQSAYNAIEAIGNAEMDCDAQKLQESYRQLIRAIRKCPLPQRLWPWPAEVKSYLAKALTKEWEKCCEDNCRGAWAKCPFSEECREEHVRCVERCRGYVPQ